MPWYEITTPGGVDITTNNREDAWHWAKRLSRREAVVVKRDGVAVWWSRPQLEIGYGTETTKAGTEEGAD